MLTYPTTQPPTHLTTPRHLRITDFTYDLPDERVAKHPLPERDQSKLLLHHPDGRLEDRTFQDLPALLPTDAMLVFNDTRVVRARLRFRRPTGAAIEVFCLEPVEQSLEQALQQTGEATWQCLVGNRKKWRDGLTLTLDLPEAGGSLSAKLAGDTAAGEPLVHFRWTPGELTFSHILAEAGKLPLPPYLHREADADDLTRYQTVYARTEGAVAAPTAGLHFTPAVFEALQARGLENLYVTLHVGAGTFRPVKADEMAGHPMHGETLLVTAHTLRRLRAAVAAGRAIIPVGTTSARTLESLYWLGARLAVGLPFRPLVAQWDPYEPNAPELPVLEALDALLEYLADTKATVLAATTHLLIAPGYRWRLVSGLITNFHQPESTLLLLVAALVGDDWQKLYHHALSHAYRFLSYGDSSLLWPARLPR